MFTKDDLIDAIVRHLQNGQAAGDFRRAAEMPSLPPARTSPSPDKRRPAAAPPGPRGRLFLSEFDIKKRLTAGQTSLTLPADAIVSPLAADWLILKGITIVRA